MFSELLELVEVRGAAMKLSKGTITREIHALKSVKPVLCLGVRAASHVEYWNRHAVNRMDGGISPSTVRAEFNYTAAILSWLIKTDRNIKSMRPNSVINIHRAIKEASRKAGKQVKRFKALDRPARVSIDDFEKTVKEIESFKSPYKEVLKMLMYFGLRASESISLKRTSFTNGMLFIPDRNTKTCANLLIPIPLKNKQELIECAGVIEDSNVTYEALLMTLTRSGVKWRSHDLRKMFRTKGAVRGEDYLAMELILNHEVKEVPNAYLQRPPYKSMRLAIQHQIEEYKKSM